MVGQSAAADLHVYHWRRRYGQSDGDAHADAEADGVAHPHADAYCYAGAYIAACYADTDYGANGDAFAGAGSGQWVTRGCRQRVGNVDLDAWCERYDALCSGDQAV